MDPDSICDRCSDVIEPSEAQDGPQGTEWEGCSLCSKCLAEVELP